jgi:hypothetical protein
VRLEPAGGRRWSLVFGVERRFAGSLDFGTWDQNSGDLIYLVLIAIIAIAFASSVNCSVLATPSILVEEAVQDVANHWKGAVACSILQPFLPLRLRSNIYI